MADGVSGQQQGLVARHPKTVGFLILLALHVVFIGGPTLLSGVALQAPDGNLSNLVALGEWTGFKREAGPLLIGIVQLFYVVPAVLLTLKLRRPAVATGIVWGAVATFVVNMAGCGVMWYGLSKIG
ncbi:MAG: hypothetical protein AB7O32_19655 [Vicinamibacterales bacterium]